MSVNEGAGSEDLFKNVRDLRKRLEETERSLISLHDLDPNSSKQLVKNSNLRFFKR